ncbi:HlyD family secretion protein [Polaromonas sp.]|uniref:HlyD family secretion protein n=1 Tax=Polaromonas sp. TaxID=1869339 RepID=UPI002FC74825
MNTRLHCAGILFAATLLAACDGGQTNTFPGYAEAEYVRLAAPISGTLAKLHLNRGDKAPESAAAFVLEQESERAARQEAAYRVARARDQLSNLRQGKRPDELAAIRAQLAQAQAALGLSSAELARSGKLVAQQFLSPASLDQARAAVARDQGRINELNAQLRQAMQGARSQEISAAEQEVKAAQAQLEQADWRVDQKTQRTPVAGDVVDVLFREGEWVPAGAAVLTLLPPANIKARFFLPQVQLGAIAIGQEVRLQCDGCGAPIPAKISFIAREAEYTSPIIYSKENRASLVFMVEARPSPQDARRLHPGQPLEVRLAAKPVGPAS